MAYLPRLASSSGGHDRALAVLEGLELHIRNPRCQRGGHGQTAAFSRLLDPTHPPCSEGWMWPPHYHLGCSSTLTLALSCGSLFSSSGGATSLQGDRRRERGPGFQCRTFFSLETSLLFQVLNEELDNREGIFNPRPF